jgi:cell division protein FtsI (penicillin-binding protein 3)
MVVIKNKPHAVRHFGGAVAAPVFREIADKLYAERKEDQPEYIAVGATDSNSYRWSGDAEDVKNIMKKMDVSYQDSSNKDQWGYMYNNNYAPALKALAVSDDIIPDLKGMGLKDALYLLENMKLKVQVKGNGRIVNQSPASGAAFSKGQTVTLELN